MCVCDLIAITANNVYESAQVWHWCGFEFPSIYFMAHSPFSVVLILILRLFVNLSLIELIAFYQPKCNLCRSSKQIHSMQTRCSAYSFFFRSLFILSSLTLSLGSDRAHFMHFTIRGWKIVLFSPMPYIFYSPNQITNDTTAKTTVTVERERERKSHSKIKLFNQQEQNKSEMVIDLFLLLVRLRKCLAGNLYHILTVLLFLYLTVAWPAKWF